MPVAEQSIEGLERCLDALGAGLGARHIGQRQPLTGKQCFDRTQQYRFAKRMHLAE